MATHLVSSRRGHVRSPKIDNGDNYFYRPPQFSPVSPGLEGLTYLRWPPLILLPRETVRAVQLRYTKGHSNSNSESPDSKLNNEADHFAPVGCRTKNTLVECRVITLKMNDPTFYPESDSWAEYIYIDLVLTWTRVQR